MRNILYIIYIIIIYISLTGCAGLYAELGVGHQIKASEVERPNCHTVVAFNEYDESMYGGRRLPCGGDDPQATISVGYEFERQGPFTPDRVEWLHRSNYFDGGHDRETYTDEVRAVWKIGGRE